VCQPEEAVKVRNERLRLASRFRRRSRCVHAAHQSEDDVHRRSCAEEQRHRGGAGGQHLCARWLSLPVSTQGPLFERCKAPTSAASSTCPRSKHTARVIASGTYLATAACHHTCGPVITIEGEE